jgi:hypothetical protein
MRRSIFACGLLLALAGIPSAVATAAGASGQQASTPLHAARARARAHSIAYWNGAARRAQAATMHWLTIVRGHPPRQSFDKRRGASPQAVRNFARIWHRRWVAASRLAHHPPHLRIWYCIHHYEGSWSDPNAPYWGGLQMDYSFQSAYGAWLLRHKGTANNWPPLAQIWAAVRGWRVRGFAPWPNTAHACGVY